jgi:hypothetical protein
MRDQFPAKEAAMTDPIEKQRDQPAEAAADPEPEVNPDVIQDLDVTGDDAGDIAGGCSWTHTSLGPQ